MRILSLLIFLIANKHSVMGAWYDGIRSIVVTDPSQSWTQASIDAAWNKQNSANQQFNNHRYAFLLKKGTYKLDVKVATYMSVAGVGVTPYDVVVSSVLSTDGPDGGGATQCFWRSLEGMHVLSNPSGLTTYAASQASPMRRMFIEGDLTLSQTYGSEVHYSSGGFMSDVLVTGDIMMGSQEQFLIRNSQASSFSVGRGGWNYVFVGVNNAPTYSPYASRPGQVTTLKYAPRTAEKPYLVEDNGDWWIYIPPYNDHNTQGPTTDYTPEWILSMNDVFVATDGMSTEDIIGGVKQKKGILFSPGIYYLDQPIVIDQSDYIVFGLGFATLISPKNGAQALLIKNGVTGVRVSGLLIEAGSELPWSANSALLQWGEPSFGTETEKQNQTAAKVNTAGKINAARKVNTTGEINTARKYNTTGYSNTTETYAGVMSDVFLRVGSFQFSGCKTTQIDSMVLLYSDNILVDNTWYWQADHDDCSGQSYHCIANRGLDVHSSGVMIYALQVEHTKDTLVEWAGEDGTVFMYQAELPYADTKYFPGPAVGYAVHSSVHSHHAYGLGTYIIGKQPELVYSGYIVSPTTTIVHALVMVIGGNIEQFENVICDDDACLDRSTANCASGAGCYVEGWGSNYYSNRTLV